MNTPDRALNLHLFEVGYGGDRPHGIKVVSGILVSDLAALGGIDDDLRGHTYLANRAGRFDPGQRVLEASLPLGDDWRVEDPPYSQRLGMPAEKPLGHAALVFTEEEQYFTIYNVRPGSGKTKARTLHRRDITPNDQEERSHARLDLLAGDGQLQLAIGVGRFMKFASVKYEPAGALIDVRDQDGNSDASGGGGSSRDPRPGGPFAPIGDISLSLPPTDPAATEAEYWERRLALA